MHDRSISCYLDILLGKSKTRVIDTDERKEKRRRQAPTCMNCGQYLRREDDLSHCDDCFDLIEEDLKQLGDASWSYPLWK